MALRKIIRIDEDLCNGCGDCITACAEGALRLVDGKARLVKERFCDGFGDCIGECPTGALVVEEREADDFDFEATRAHVATIGGSEALLRFDTAAEVHAAREAGAGNPGPGSAPGSGPGAVALPMMAAHHGGGCPGSRVMFRPDPPASEGSAREEPGSDTPSELRQWPVQIHLVPPGAPFFRDREMVIMNTCGPLAHADTHRRFLRGRSVVVGCPKLDDTRPYADKLAAILRDGSIPKVSVVRMEVPCCGGLTAIAREAVQRSGRDDLAFEEVILSVGGDILGTRPA